jgi:type 1 glutamine amidotransferase
MRLSLLALGFAAAACSSASLPSTELDGGTGLGVFVFSRTEGFRHDSIPAAREAILKRASENGWYVFAKEAAEDVTAERLATMNVVVFLLTTGDVLDAPQEAALEQFVRGGGGFVGVHSASDTEYDWPFYQELIGAHFDSHPLLQQLADVKVEDAAHPSTSQVPNPWSRSDEWYNFRRNPRGDVQVLLTVDESSYSGGNMGADHPIAWSRSLDAGRSFYTALGHSKESYGDSTFVAHLRGAIEWAGE